MDAITLLKNDHKSVERLFKRFEKTGDRAYAEKRKIVDKIIEELSMHAAIEETALLPGHASHCPRHGGHRAREPRGAPHREVGARRSSSRCRRRTSASTPRSPCSWRTCATTCEEEEEDYFPKVRDELGRNALSDLGDAMEAAKATAPTHPHPRSPDTPAVQPPRPGPRAASSTVSTDTASGWHRAGSRPSAI